MAASGTADRRLTIALLGSTKSTHVRARARAMADRGHRVVWLTTEPAGVLGVEEIPLSGARSLLFRAANRVSRRLGHISLDRLPLYQRLSSALDALNPDVVHIHYAASVPAWLAAATDRHPLVVSVMGGDVLFGEQQPTTALGRWLTREVFESADLITAKSDHLIHALGVHGKKAMRLVWGVDLKQFRRTDPRALRKKLGLADDVRVVLSPKILQPFYNIHLVIEAMAMVPGAVLLVTEYAADATYKAELIALIARLGLGDRVRFVGAIAAEEMADYYSLAAVAVAVPPSDGLPQALFEAMACEVPNVLANLPRYQEVVSDRESVLFVEIEPSSIARGINALLDDPALAERIRSRGRKIAEEGANLQNEVVRFEAALYALLGKKHEKRSRLARAAIVAGTSAF